MCKVKGLVPEEWRPLTPHKHPLLSGFDCKSGFPILVCVSHKWVCVGSHPTWVAVLSFSLNPTPQVGCPRNTGPAGQWASPHRGEVVWEGWNCGTCTLKHPWRRAGNHSVSSGNAPSFLARYSTLNKVSAGRVAPNQKTKADRAFGGVFFTGLLEFLPLSAWYKTLFLICSRHHKGIPSPPQSWTLCSKESSLT